MAFGAENRTGHGEERKAQGGGQVEGRADPFHIRDRHLFEAQTPFYGEGLPVKQVIAAAEGIDPVDQERQRTENEQACQNPQDQPGASLKGGSLPDADSQQDEEQDHQEAESGVATLAEGGIAGRFQGVCLKAFLDDATDRIDLRLAHHAGERQGQAAVAEVFGDRKIAGQEAEALTHVRLQVDGGEVRPGRDTLFADLFGKQVTINAGRKADDIHEPRHACCEWLQNLGFDARHPGQALAIPGSHAVAFGAQLLQAGELHGAQGGGHLVQAVVVAEVGVLQPGIADGAALVAQGAHEIGGGGIICDDNPALAGGDLLVGVEGEYAEIANGPGRAALVFGSESLAGVFDDRQLILPGNPQDRVKIGGLTEDVDGQDGFERAIRLSPCAGQPAAGFFASGHQVMRGSFDQFRINVAGARVNIHKDRDGVLEQEHVAGSHKGEGRGDDGIPSANSGGAHAQVQSGCAGVDRRWHADCRSVGRWPLRIERSWVPCSGWGC